MGLGVCGEYTGGAAAGMQDSQQVHRVRPNGTPISLDGLG